MHECDALRELLKVIVLREFEERRPREEGEGRKSKKYESDGDRLGTSVGFAQCNLMIVQ